jgi:hypothetical protein
VRSSWEHIGNNKNPSPSPPKEKELGPLVHATSPHWLEILILLKFLGINNKYNFKSSTKPKNIFNLCQNGKGITVYICLFQKEPFDWPNTNIFGTWSTPPQHRSLNTFPSPKIKACFLIVLSAPLLNERRGVPKGHEFYLSH